MAGTMVSVFTFSALLFLAISMPNPEEEDKKTRRQPWLLNAPGGGPATRGRPRRPCPPESLRIPHTISESLILF